MPCALVTLPVHPRTRHTPVDPLLQVELPSRLSEGQREGEEEKKVRGGGGGERGGSRREKVISACKIKRSITKRIEA